MSCGREGVIELRISSILVLKKDDSSEAVGVEVAVVSSEVSCETRENNAFALFFSE